jgi:UDP-glucose 4-epimerase
VTRILVTGGAGYVGSVSAEAFLAAGHDVVVLDDLTTGHRAAVPPGAALHVGTYADTDALIHLLDAERIEAILHCAARSLVGESIRDPSKYYSDNVAGGVALLEAARAAGVGRIVFSSTAAVYGIPDHTPIPEDAPLRPINPYGESKRAFEGALGWYGRAYGSRSVTLRYFNVAGATATLGEDHHPETHLIPNVLHAAEGTQALTVFGDDYDRRRHVHPDYIHVADLADAPSRAIEATPATIAPTSHCLQPQQRRRARSAGHRRAEAIVGREIPVTTGPRRAGDPPILVARSTRAADLLGWRPTRPTLEEMVGSAWAWRRSHPDGYPD